MQQPLSVCSSLKGRNSDYITPHNIPLNVTIDNRSLDFTNVLLQNLLHHTNTLQICYELYIYLLCLVALPPCNNSTSAPLLLCPETCRAYENLLSIGACDSYSSAIVEVHNASIESRKLIPYIKAFNCYNPASYFHNGVIESQDSCTNLFGPESQGEAVWLIVFEVFMRVYICFRRDIVG